MEFNCPLCPSVLASGTLDHIRRHFNESSDHWNGNQIVDSFTCGVPGCNETFSVVPISIIRDHIIEHRRRRNRFNQQSEQGHIETHPPSYPNIIGIELVA